MMRWLMLVILLALGLSACGGDRAGGLSPTTTNPEPTRLRVGLDWTPNTNHTGLYVARDRGFYREQGLEVEILQAQEGGTVEQLVATGRLDLGISYQEAVTEARVVGLPIVSVAAIIQSNTSGFASRAAKGITTPADFAGHRYGAWGSPVEQAVIAGLMECVGADASQVQFVDIGSSDFFVATERDAIDFAWIFAGWTGVEAALRGIDLNIVMIRDLNCIPDYYTPVLITSEELIATQPDLLKRFMAATSAGYQYAVEEPDAAATILLQAAPELDAELVTQSQAYLANEYQGNAPRWGEQRVEVWRDYAQWMVDRDLLSTMIDPEEAFTNAFLP